MGMATETTWLVLAIALAVLNCGAGTCTALGTSTAGEHGGKGCMWSVQHAGVNLAKRVICGGGTAIMLPN